jgi:outer membrane protein OmpA-like peptidoglycan-associated protein
MKNLRSMLLCTACVCLVTLGSSSATAGGQQESTKGSAFVDGSVKRGEKTKVEGLVVSRQGDVVTLRSANANDVKVEITDFTKVATRRGLFRKKSVSISELLPGLWIKVKGVGDSPGHVLAESISLTSEDLRTARAIQAGLVPLDSKVQANQKATQENAQSIRASEQQIHANEQQIEAGQQQIQTNQHQINEANQRISELADYDLKYATSINFAAGRADLSPGAKSQLMRLANDASSLKGYVLQVKGYTDSSGSLAVNQALSMHRAQSVIAYLEQSGNIPLTHVLTPGAMGESHPISSNETAEGRAENRRVEVKVLVSRGLAGR